MAFGYRTESFASAEAFLASPAKSEASCLVVDLHLERSSGLDLVRQLSASGVRLPVIVMTGSGNDALREQAAELGCIAYLEKPISPDLLLAAISDAMRPQTS